MSFVPRYPIEKEFPALSELASCTHYRARAVQYHRLCPGLCHDSISTASNRPRTNVGNSCGRPGWSDDAGAKFGVNVTKAGTQRVEQSSCMQDASHCNVLL